MINAEKYRKEILAVTNKHEYFALKADNPTVITRCNDVEQCRGCLFDNGTCSSEKMKWLLSEYKEPIKLSKVEYEILRYLYKRDYRYIAREKSERVIAFKGCPHKRDYDVWNTISGEKTGYLDLYDFSNLFQFTNWEDSEPTLIQGVLNNCEVAESDL